MLQNLDFVFLFFRVFEGKVNLSGDPGCLPPVPVMKM